MIFKPGASSIVKFAASGVQRNLNLIAEGQCDPRNAIMAQRKVGGIAQARTSGLSTNSGYKNSGNPARPAT